MQTRIYHTENAGVYLQTEKTAILIDGIHGAGAVGFSPMPMEEETQIEEKAGMFASLDGLLFTHLHIDHFKAGEVNRFLQEHPEVALWGPGLEKRHLQKYEEDGEEVRFSIGDFSVRAYRTDHSGKPYQKEPHFSLALCNEACGETIFIAGDAVFYPEQAMRIREEIGRIDLIFLMFYQIVEESSLQFLECLEPGRFLLYHCPAPEDDTYHQLSMIRQILERDPLPGHKIEVPPHHQWIT